MLINYHLSINIKQLQIKNKLYKYTCLRHPGYNPVLNQIAKRPNHLINLLVFPNGFLPLKSPVAKVNLEFLTGFLSILLIILACFLANSRPILV
jgi:hypothetical protein